MFPRYPADGRTLLWALLMSVVLVAQYCNPSLVPFLAPISFYFAVAAGTIAHNHGHRPVFANKGMNGLFSAWISFFYGTPSFGWIPTHRANHHRYTNRAGDATITWRHTNRNTWYVAVTYFFVATYHQWTLITDYIRDAKAKNPTLYRRIVMECALTMGAPVVMFAIAVAMHGWTTGIVVFSFSYGLPMFFGQWAMMLFNYMQHVHADPWDRFNHSRNITGRLFNFLLFNNGLHTVHHNNASAHWSTAYEAHAKIADKIDPSLNVRSFWWWVVRGYILPAFVPGSAFETKQLGRAPFDPPAQDE